MWSRCDEGKVVMMAMTQGGIGIGVGQVGMV